MQVSSILPCLSSPVCGSVKRCVPRRTRVAATDRSQENVALPSGETPQLNRGVSIKPYTRDDFIRRGLLDLRKWRQHKLENKTMQQGEEFVNTVSPWMLPICLITYSTWMLAWASELGGSTAPSWIAPTLGAVLGAAFSAAHRYGTVRAWKEPRRPLNIVITGATRGIGRAIARDFVHNGDNVYIASRSPKAVRQTVAELREKSSRPLQVGGVDCDVTSPSSVSRLASQAKAHFQDGTIDVWINNAGCSGSFKSFLEADPAAMQQVVQTNLLGALLCTRAALQIMKKQDNGGHVFNMDGAGADGAATPNYAVYGATKAGIAHMMSSIAAEVEGSGLDIGVHTLSPGMVLTELLLDGATLQNKQVFNVLCEQPEVVAAYLVPRIRTVCARNETMAYIKFLTNHSAIGRFLTAPLRLGRFFSADGTATYPDEMERLVGSHSKRTARLLTKARSRDAFLRLAYSLSLTVSVAALCMPVAL